MYIASQLVGAMDTTVTITIPGWVWLLLAAAVFIYLAWRMVRTIGFADLFLFGDPSGPNEWMRFMVFILLVGTAGLCIRVTVSHLLS